MKIAHLLWEEPWAGSEAAFLVLMLMTKCGVTLGQASAVSLLPSSEDEPSDFALSTGSTKQLLPSELLAFS